MSVITQAAQAPVGSDLDCYIPYRMTVEKYEALVASGVFTKRDKFQLVNGRLVSKMTKNPPHSIAKGNCADALRRVTRAITTRDWHVREEDPVRLPPFNEPEPDISVARGKRGDYSHHPGSAEIGLLAEVSDSTLADDRKMCLTYAATGVAVYWIVNLVGRCVEVYTSPTPGGYQNQEVYGPGTSVPVTLDGVVEGEIAVDDVLP
jgi:Uma2 family endonuclease